MASAEVVATRLAGVLGDPEVRGVLVTVFGGITACAAVTSGILRALGIPGETATRPLMSGSTATTSPLAGDYWPRRRIR